MPEKLIRRLVELNTKDCLWIYILSILSEKPVHAYSIRNIIEMRFGFRPGNVTAYRVLYYLTTKGYVNNKAEGRRKIYSITPSGKKELSNAIGFYKKQISILGE
ncbi:MAG: PadR family transcriptional regulator [Candidatus Aenigmarchaeota archaeon]|nr:PadR family transcriptional regulator [Candidatus Aenigmarchaeota archaeon]